MPESLLIAPTPGICVNSALEPFDNSAFISCPYNSNRSVAISAPRSRSAHASPTFVSDSTTCDSSIRTFAAPLTGSSVPQIRLHFFPARIPQPQRERLAVLALAQRRQHHPRIVNRQQRS